MANLMYQNRGIQTNTRESVSQRQSSGKVLQDNRQNSKVNQLMTNAPVQRVSEEEEPLQGKFANQDTAQLEQQPAAKPNNTGLPDNLKSGIESLSGMSMENVRVHYNSAKPAQLNALAYAQGTDIHVASGQEKHLPHEAWHVVQQAQGRVKPTVQMKIGLNVNDDIGLEHEADVMGSKALRSIGDGAIQANRQKVGSSGGIVQQTPDPLAHPLTKIIADCTSYETMRSAGDTDAKHMETYLNKNIQDKTPTYTEADIPGIIADPTLFETMKSAGYTNTEQMATYLKDNIRIYRKEKIIEEAFKSLPPSAKEDTEYHFGLNKIGPNPQSYMDPRTEHIKDKEIKNGTIATLDWDRKYDLNKLPNIKPLIESKQAHIRLSGESRDGSSHLESIISIRNALHTALHEHQEILDESTYSKLKFDNKFQQHTFYRKAININKNNQTKNILHGDAYKNDRRALGADFSKAALMDQLVQGHTIHMHLTGMTNKQTGKLLNKGDFMKIINKETGFDQILHREGARNNITMRELRFIHKHWDKKLSLLNDEGKVEGYQFNGKTIFYFQGEKIPPPWQWENKTTTGETKPNLIHVAPHVPLPQETEQALKPVPAFLRWLRKKVRIQPTAREQSVSQTQKQAPPSGTG